MFRKFNPTKRASSSRSVRGGRWRWRRLRDWLLGIAIISLLAHLILGQDGFQPRLEGVPHVADGDSLSLDGERIRLKGIDAPELGQICIRDGKAYECGREAKRALVGLIGGRQVICKASERDRYGRLLAVCSAGEIELNKAIVESGWAIAYGDYETVELRARLASRGLWAGSFDRPQAWRADHQTAQHGDDENWFYRLGSTIGHAVWSWLQRIFEGSEA